MQPVAPRAGNASPSATSRQSQGPGAKSGLGFPRERRIRKRADFRAVYDGGSRTGTRLFSVFILATGSPEPGRVGFTVTKRLGNAVTRNRCKRLLREAVRRNWSLVPDGVDMVLHARPGMVGARAGEVEYAIAQALPKAIRRLA